MVEEISMKEIALPFSVAGAESFNVDLDYVSKLLESNNLGYSGKGIKVAVLDTGVNSNHPMLVNKVILKQNFTNGDIEDSIVGHGTFVSSEIAGNHILTDGYVLHGISPDARIINVKVLDDTGSGQFSVIIEGIHWAVTNGANIINMSLGAPYDDNGESPLSQTIDWARSKGVITCVASGNSNTTGAPSPNTPGTAKSSITVGSINTKGVVSSFSSRGGASKYPYPTLCAYGGDFPDGEFNTDEGIIGAFKDGYSSLRGTSMSTPEVAGICAILMEKLGNADLVEQSLIKGAIDIDTPGIDNNTGYGKANAKKAIESTVAPIMTKSNIGKFIIYLAIAAGLGWLFYNYRVPK